MTSPDTAQCSLEHWSEAGRPEMEAFHALATEAVEHPVTPFTTAEQVVATLRGLGVAPDLRVLTYRTRSADLGVVEGFLQRCAFDDSLTLAEMEAHGPLADYLGGCRDAAGFHFDHEVQLITWSS